MNRPFARAVRLEAKMIQRSMPGWASGLVVLALLVAALQEPPLFRQSDLQVYWPLVFGLADLAAILCCLTALSVGATVPHSARLPRFVSCSVSAFFSAGALVLAAVLVDGARAVPTPWSTVLAGSIRFTLVWPALLILAHGTSKGSVAFGAVRMLLAAGLQLAVHPSGQVLADCNADKILASALAVVGALVTIGHNSKSS